jgi:hypothetical protein
MVKCRHAFGQATTEFVLMLAFMTLLGVILMNAMIGPDKQSGSIKSAENNTISGISNDEK